MDVIVTGGRGQTGRWVVDRLAADHAVPCLDRALPEEGHPGVDYRALDLTDAGGVFDVVTALEPDAVVHWAAIPVAGQHPGVDLYRNNTLAAHAVLSAAGRVGARVVQASSDGAYGFFFADETPLPEALPVAETHPLCPEDPYGLSKLVAEEVGKTVARREGVPVVSLRPTWIQEPGEYPCRAEGYLEDLAAGQLLVLRRRPRRRRHGRGGPGRGPERSRGVQLCRPGQRFRPATHRVGRGVLR